MVEVGGRGDPPQDEERPDDMIQAEKSRGSGVIFALVAIALILAIGFFYLTKEREDRESRVITDAAESADSAARVIENAAQDAASSLRRQN
ncbi:MULTISPECIES: hypothetical protein [unclassified Sphingobium]|uniref:hypothetical protein n=1 Tax=unclassified Sphingobium TaxID=2611147 RepID=UPI001A10EE44|nr:hypothetical protein SPHS8_00298 [Sphingobium sp. S8]CAD7335040.1 hypothetical protein SPHS6_00298 [Sphingobium sp. S6]